jgi:hypothetical protein
MTQEITEEHELHLDIRKKWILAILCLCAGGAPLACRWIANDVARFSSMLLITVVFLAFTLVARKQSILRTYWELSFAFFILAFVVLLNNLVPYFGLYILHTAPVAGNPMSSTVLGTVILQLVDTFIAIGSVIVLTKVSGMSLDSIYARNGKIGWWFAFSILVFVIIYLLMATGHTSRFIPTNRTLTFARFLTLTPALLALVISNGFQEEFLFRGLFLQKYNAFFSPLVSIILQAIVFSIAHLGVTYTASAVVFTILLVFPLGLFTGYLMHATKGVTTPAIFHAGVDIPIYLAFLSYVS